MLYNLYDSIHDNEEKCYRKGMLHEDHNYNTTEGKEVMKEYGYPRAK